MSGVAGAERIRSRKDFAQFLSSYYDLISQFTKDINIAASGSYNSDLAKQDFGDIDLIVTIPSILTKKLLKKKLVDFFHAQSEDIIVPFSNPKYKNKRTYNSGEIVSVRYHDKDLGYSVQIDNIIALNQYEADFKLEFLNMTAAVQGLVLGLVKVAALETPPAQLFSRLGIVDPGILDKNQEYEFNLSSKELQLRRVQYELNTFNQISQEILWASSDYENVKKLLYQYQLDSTFINLMTTIKNTIKNPRSSNRIKGLFASMITVKSGEVGTVKGNDKLQSLQFVQQSFIN
jgi:hypothetical protein